MARITRLEAARSLLRPNAAPQSFIVVSKTAGRAPVGIAGNVLNSQLGTIVSFQGVPGGDLNGAAGAFGDAVFGQLSNFAGLPAFVSGGSGGMFGLGNGPGGSITPGPIGKHGGGGDPAADDGDDSTGGATSNTYGTIVDTTTNTDGTTSTTTISGGDIASVDENGVVTLSTIDAVTTTDDGAAGGEPPEEEPNADHEDDESLEQQLEDATSSGPGDDDEKIGAAEIIAGIATVIATEGSDNKTNIASGLSMLKGYYDVKKGYQKNHPTGPGPTGPGPHESGQNSDPDGSGQGSPRQFVGEKPNPETGSGGGPHSFGERPAPDSAGQGTPHSFSLRGSATIGTRTFTVALTRAVSGATLLFISPGTKAGAAAKAGIRLQVSP